jgi:2-methylisocitrate lyase-like PEP mutase family enzyme
MESSHPSTAQKRSAFRRLHATGTFVIPNPWDVGSARLLQQLGFSALASTSSGLSWSNGQPDYSLELPVLLEHLQRLCAAVDLPVSADFQEGFAREPEKIALNVARVLETGVAGLSIEDTQVEDAARLYDRGLAVERIRAARSAISQAGADVVLVARTELLLHDAQALSPAIDKLVAFAEAGADCLFAPGVVAKQDIASMVRAVAPKPLNVLMMKPGPSVAELAELGVRRISVGGALARVAWGAMLAAARQIQAGSFAGLASAASGAELNASFESFVNKTRG